RGGAPMAPFAEPVLAQRDELLHDRQHRIADALGLAPDLRHVELRDEAMLDDLVAGVLRNDAEPRLRARERRLEVEIFLDAVLVGEHVAHRLGREDVAEYGGVDGGRVHGVPSEYHALAGSRGAAMMPKTHRAGDSRVHE